VLAATNARASSASAEALVRTAAVAAAGLSVRTAAVLAVRAAHVATTAGACAVAGHWLAAAWAKPRMRMSLE